jgi:uncharacterized heparinase superfamily protein
MPADLIAKIRRGLQKPPRVIADRVLQEVRAQAERHLAPRRTRRLSALSLARDAGFATVDTWWDALAKRGYPAQTSMPRDVLDRICPGDYDDIIRDADRAIAREVNLLGSGPIQLGTPTDWHKDYKTGLRWPPAYCHDIEYSNLDRPSDVKFPWEVSRMQWLMPAGQAYAISKDEDYAVSVRDIIDEWIEANPCAMSVNWSCTMDVALRLMTWTWFFHVFHASRAWSEPSFRQRFLHSLYLHGDFTARHLEKSDINGNHYTADAAGLVFAGVFFGPRGEPKRWLDLGWQILIAELPRQVFPDGVDFEASIPYHRLVQELFLFPALYRQKHALDVPPAYIERLRAMAEFTAAYSRPDGSVPLWGDADDARALPFRQKPINDHRYLLALAGQALREPSLIDAFSGPRSEPIWWFGAGAAAALPDRAYAPIDATSKAFSDGGFYILRHGKNHVFADCGPLGLAGRGGHGHNDILSFDAMLDGVHLVTDCGAYLYTANATERNNFRSTAYHNTPLIDGVEINRFIRPDYLWTLHDDAVPLVNEWLTNADSSRIVMRHTGYGKLAAPVIVCRTVTLNSRGQLTITDVFEGTADHTIETPLHLATGVRAEHCADKVILTAGNKQFSVTLDTAASSWDLSIEAARVSPTYGVVQRTTRLVWRHSGPLRPLTVTIEPISTGLER